MTHTPRFDFTDNVVHRVDVIKSYADLMFFYIDAGYTHKEAWQEVAIETDRTDATIKAKVWATMKGDTECQN